MLWNVIHNEITPFFVLLHGQKETFSETEHCEINIKQNEILNISRNKKALMM